MNEDEISEDTYQIALFERLRDLKEGLERISKELGDFKSTVKDLRDFAREHGFFELADDYDKLLSVQLKGYPYDLGLYEK